MTRPGDGGPWVYPNIGAEEAKFEDIAGSAARTGRLSSRIAGLWSMLFADGVTLLPDGGAGPWPAAFGERPATAAFGWLEGKENAWPWLSTVAAHDALVKGGFPVAGPSADVVREVHDKLFALDEAVKHGYLPPTFADRIACVDEDLIADERLSRLARRLESWPPECHGRFTLKPRWGGSGRGRVAGRIDRLDLLPMKALLRFGARGGAILEPWVDRTMDLSTQLHVGGGGEVEILATMRQLLSTAGLYAGNRGRIDAAGAVSAGTIHDERIAETALAIVRSAAMRGFNGPCGVDAFVFKAEADVETLRPAVEMNARFTTGTIALGLLRRAHESGYFSGACAWVFHLDAAVDRWQEIGRNHDVEVVLLGTDGDDDGGAQAALAFSPSEEILDLLLDHGPVASARSTP